MPTKELFEAWLAFVESWEKYDSPGAARLDRATDMFCETLAEDLSNLAPVADQFYTAMWALESDISDQLLATEAVHWLVKQPGYVYCTQKISKGALTIEQFRRQQEERMAKATTYEEAQKIAKQLRWRVRPSSFWRHDVLAALAWYFHGDHEAYRRGLLTLTTRNAEIVAMLQDIQPVLQQTFGFARTTSHLIDEIKGFKDVRAPRSSKLEAEQTFMQMMIRVNFRRFGTGKPDLIASLMTLPGFDHRFEPRHISRYCTSEKRTEFARFQRRSVRTKFPPSIDKSS